MKAKPIHDVDPFKVKIFVHRTRAEAEFEQVVANIKKHGQKHPAQVRDITHLPKEQRMEDGRLCDWGLITGEGRTLACRRLKRKLLAFVEKQKDAELVSTFLGENLNREALPWACKARLIEPELKAGRTFEQIAEQLQISVSHVQKFHRILSKTAPETEAEIASMPINDAEVLTTLKPAEQKIVLDAMRESGVREVKAMVRKAREAIEAQPEAELSKKALADSLKRLDEDLKRTRDQLKLARRDLVLGPENLQFLLSQPEFRRQVVKKKINISHFESLS